MRRGSNCQIPETKIAELAANHPVQEVEVKDDIDQAQKLKEHEHL